MLRAIEWFFDTPQDEEDLHLPHGDSAERAEELKVTVSFDSTNAAADKEVLRRYGGGDTHVCKGGKRA